MKHPQYVDLAFCAAMGIVFIAAVYVIGNTMTLNRPKKMSQNVVQQNLPKETVEEIIDQLLKKIKEERGETAREKHPGLMPKVWDPTIDMELEESLPPSEAKAIEIIPGKR